MRSLRLIGDAKLAPVDCVARRVTRPVNPDAHVVAVAEHVYASPFRRCVGPGVQKAWRELVIHREIVDARQAKGLAVSKSQQKRSAYLAAKVARLIRQGRGET